MSFKKVENSILRFAIVGFGFIGQRYARMLASNPFSELAAIVDTHAAITLPEKEQPIKLFNSLDELLSSDLLIDAVIISSPNGYHAEQALKVLKTGKHAIIEKPVSLSAADITQIIKAAADRSIYAFSVVPNRYASTSVWLKSIVDSGVLGDIFLVQINCYWNRDNRYYNNHWRGTEALDGGPLFTQFYHFVDILYWIFGDIVNIKAKFADFNHQHLTETEDSGFVQFDLVRGGIGLLNYSTSAWSTNLESSITILAENGSIKIGGQYMDKIEACTVKGHDPASASLNHPTNSQQNHQRLVDEVVDIIKGKKQFEGSINDAVHVVDIINRIYSSREISKALQTSP